MNDALSPFVALASDSLEASGAEHDHDRAVLIFAAMVGGLAVSRAMAPCCGAWIKRSPLALPRSPIPVDKPVHSRLSVSDTSRSLSRLD
jgi:hypothetical protein